MDFFYVCLSARFFLFAAISGIRGWLAAWQAGYLMLRSLPPLVILPAVYVGWRGKLFKSQGAILVGIKPLEVPDSFRNIDYR